MKKHSLSFTAAAEAVPPHAWFAVSALSRYLGPSFAVLLFPAIGVLGIAWLRIASAALVFGLWVRPWQAFRRAGTTDRWLLVGLGACLATMNTAFYLALDRLPLSLVAAIEFAGVIGVALYGLRTRRNMIALALTGAGIVVLVDFRWASDPLGLFWAFLNATLFVGYIMLGHRISERGASGGVELLGAAMMVAFLVILPIGVTDAATAIRDPMLLLAGLGVGVCSSVIPYVCDQLAMSRLPRASFALLLALLPATATIIGALVLAQVPGAGDVVGVLLVMLGIAIHRPAASTAPLRAPNTGAGSSSRSG